MATGERTFSSSGRSVKRFDNTPVASGRYKGLLKLQGWKIAKGQGAGKLPRLSGPIELMDTGANGGKNRQMFHDFYLDTTPSAKDGASMVERGGGLIEFGRAMGVEVEGIHLERMKKIDDSGAESARDVLNPQEALRWLKQFDGVPFEMQIKIEKGTGGYEDRNRVSYFVEGDGTVEVAEDATDDATEEMEFESDAAPVETAEDTELPIEAAEEEAEWEEETTPAPQQRRPVQKSATKPAPTKNGIARKVQAIAAAKKPAQRQTTRR